MKYTLFWRMCTVIGVGTVLLFWAIDWLTNHTESSMSFIAQEHQQQLLDYGKKPMKFGQMKAKKPCQFGLRCFKKKSKRG